MYLTRCSCLLIKKKEIVATQTHAEKNNKNKKIIEVALVSQACQYGVGHSSGIIIRCLVSCIIVDEDQKGCSLVCMVMPCVYDIPVKQTTVV